MQTNLSPSFLRLRSLQQYRGHWLYLECVLKLTEVIKLFSCSTQLRMKFVLPMKIKYQQFKRSAYTAELSMKFFLLINIKMPTNVGILIFISRKNFMLNWVEYEKSFMTLGSGRGFRIKLSVFSSLDEKYLICPRWSLMCQSRLVTPTDFLLSLSIPLV